MKEKSNTRVDAPVICFIDDDPDELARFEAAMNGRFRCITEEGYDECQEKLKKDGLKPDLWVLDLFFPEDGRVNTRKEIATMNDLYAGLEEHIREFRTELKKLGQGAEGGIELLQKCTKDYSAPVVMFTRKGTLDDAIQCIDKGAAAVLKKPMPSDWPDDPAEKKKSVDDAMILASSYLTNKFLDVISSHSFRKKHKGAIGFIAGAVVSAVIGQLLTLVM